MVAYKLSKNGWVLPFFVIFRLTREKLLVTVTLDHPVSAGPNLGTPHISKTDEFTELFRKGQGVIFNPKIYNAKFGL